ncbi:MAG: hypothetical protein V1800_09415 [Candidatus Latescibacterota bacterium]
MSSEPVAPKHKADIHDLGIPVRSVNWVRLHAGSNREGAPCIYATMGQQGDNLFVLQIDPETGGFRQFISNVPGSNYPTATLMSRTGRLYVGSAYAGHLLCFDPQKDRFQDLGAIHAEAATFPCRMDEDAEGRIWIGSYGAADLTSYDPAAGQFTRHGRMDAVDMYNYPWVSADGTIACMVRMTRPHVVVFDPHTGEQTVVGPVATQGEDGIELFRGKDGLLYIESSQGNYRIEGRDAISVAVLPDPTDEPALPGGTTFGFVDADQQRNRMLEIRSPDGAGQTFELDYELSGSEIFYVHAGPDGKIYGSSVLPLHLFRYHPNDGELIDLGKCSTADGEAYSMANLDGKLYIAAYPGATLSVHDPTLPFHFGPQPGDSPRDLGRIDDLSFRPRSTLAGPMGRIWTASIPDYGRWGGPLSWYDPKTEEKHAYYRICGDASCYTLAWLTSRNLIAVGTTIRGGSGTEPKVHQAVLFLWDYQAAEKVWEGTPDRPVTSVNALLAGPNGRLYGTIQGADGPELFVFDPVARAFIHRLGLPPGDPLDLGLQNGPDGKIYGFTTGCIYRLDPDLLSAETVLYQEDGITVAGPILGRNIYFAAGHRLQMATIF